MEIRLNQKSFIVFLSKRKFQPGVCRKRDTKSLQCANQTVKFNVMCGLQNTHIFHHCDVIFSFHITFQWKTHSSNWKLSRNLKSVAILNLIQVWIISQKWNTVEPRLTTTSLIGPPRYYDHFFVLQMNWNSSHFLSITTSLVWPPRYYDRIFAARRWSY